MYVSDGGRTKELLPIIPGSVIIQYFEKRRGYASQGGEKISVSQKRKKESAVDLSNQHTPS